MISDFIGAGIREQLSEIRKRSSMNRHCGMRRRSGSSHSDYSVAHTLSEGECHGDALAHVKTCEPQRGVMPSTPRSTSNTASLVVRTVVPSGEKATPTRLFPLSTMEAS